MNRLDFMTATVCRCVVVKFFITFVGKKSLVCYWKSIEAANFYQGSISAKKMGQSVMGERIRCVNNW